MKTKQPFKHPILLLSAAAVTLIGAAAVLVLLWIFPKDKRTDYKRLSSENYDTVFLSMYPIDHFNEEDFTYWRGMNIVKADYVLPSLSAVKSYMNLIARSGNTITTVYLGALPEKLNAGELAELLSGYPGVRFEIILPNPSMDYWLQLSETKCADILADYRGFVAPFLPYDNMSVYFLGASEWLIANPANYCGDFLTAEEASLIIMLNSDRDHSYELTAENTESTIDRLAALIDKYRSAPIRYPDASDYSIIFLGDSVIGNFTGNTSIPGVVAGLTNAQIFNFGYGGGSATETPDDNNSLPDIANAIIYKDTSYLAFNAENTRPQQLSENLQSFFDTPLRDKLCFVISYGLNDYYSGYEIDSENPFDVYTYAGALRTAVLALQQAYLDARILLMTPNFTSYFGNGTQPCGDGTHPLEDFVDCVIALSAELDVELLDNHHELGINGKNHFTYLSDGCHPNETGRFLIGQRISVKLGDTP